MVQLVIGYGLYVLGRMRHYDRKTPTNCAIVEANFFRLLCTCCVVKKGTADVQTFFLDARRSLSDQDIEVFVMRLGVVLHKNNSHKMHTVEAFIFQVHSILIVASHLQLLRLQSFYLKAEHPLIKVYVGTSVDTPNLIARPNFFLLPCDNVLQ